MELFLRMNSSKTILMRSIVVGGWKYLDCLKVGDELNRETRMRGSEREDGISFIDELFHTILHLNI